MARRKIAILGGGAGAMTAAFYLTCAPDWRERYDITVYQLGWRFGGKGASGRNRAAAVTARRPIGSKSTDCICSWASTPMRSRRCRRCIASSAGREA